MHSNKIDVCRDRGKGCHIGLNVTSHSDFRSATFGTDREITLAHPGSRRVLQGQTCLRVGKLTKEKQSRASLRRKSGGR